MARASNPPALNLTRSPFAPSAITSTVGGREMSSKISGKLRQPSGPATGSPAVFNSGLISTNGMNAATSEGLPSSSRVDGRSFMPRTSRTVSRKACPICWAARPTPAASYIVSNMSAMSWEISGVMDSMYAPFCRNTGWPNLTMGRIIEVRFTCERAAG